MAAASAGAQVPGRIFPTDFNGAEVSVFYVSKDEVFLDGGPVEEGAVAGLPDGEYFCKVTSPGGGLLGKSLDPVILVVNGRFAEGYRLSDILCSASSRYTEAGFDDTRNPGGEYKVWISMNPAFPGSESKTESFKVPLSQGAPPPKGLGGREAP